MSEAALIHRAIASCAQKTRQIIFPTTHLRRHPNFVSRVPGFWVVPLLSLAKEYEYKTR